MIREANFASAPPPGEIGETGEISWGSPTGTAAPVWKQPAIFPPDSILADWYSYAREQLESADSFLIGSILPVAAAIIGRRLWFPWGDQRQFCNLFAMLAGRAGDRKSSCIGLAAALARRTLPTNAFLPSSFSPESLFDEYAESEGGRPDKIWIMDEGNTVLADWQKSGNGERVAARFLQLYDCGGLSESFRRNRESGESSQRHIEETSTSVLLGATFNAARFQGAAVRAGMARRFVYYVADGHGRIITRPPRRDASRWESIQEDFAKLATYAGPMDFADTEAEEIWDAFQHENRRKQSACNPFDDAALSRLGSAPMQTLHIAMIFQACRWAAQASKPFRHVIEAEILTLAIQHVDAAIEAAAFLEGIADRAKVADEAEILLAHIRRDFKSKTEGSAIILTRSELTSRFCNNPGRGATLTTEALYLRIIPALEKQGLARRLPKHDRTERFAFRPE